MTSGGFTRRAARRVWKRMPAAVQPLHSRAFLGVVRDRNVVTRVDGLRFDLGLGAMIDAGIYPDSFEREVTRAIKFLYRPGWCVVDVGAKTSEPRRWG